MKTTEILDDATAAEWCAARGLRGCFEDLAAEAAVRFPGMSLNLLKLWEGRGEAGLACYTTGSTAGDNGYSVIWVTEIKGYEMPAARVALRTLRKNIEAAMFAIGAATETIPPRRDEYSDN